MKKNVPICSECLYMELSGRANITGKNMYIGGPRGYCMCSHPMALEMFNKVCPNSRRLACFIGYTKPGGNTPQTKTSPKWCPRRIRWIPENFAIVTENEYGVTKCGACGATILCDECGDMPLLCSSCGKTLDYTYYLENRPGRQYCEREERP